MAQELILSELADNCFHAVYAKDFLLAGFTMGLIAVLLLQRFFPRLIACRRGWYFVAVIFGFISAGSGLFFLVKFTRLVF